MVFPTLFAVFLANFMLSSATKTGKSAYYFILKANKVYIIHVVYMEPSSRPSSEISLILNLFLPNFSTENPL